MAANPKPLRTLEKRHFRNRVRQKNFKKSIGQSGFGSREHYVLYKRKVFTVDFRTWAIWFEVYSRNRGRVIKSTQVDRDPPIRVSTVFLGIDHGFNFSGDRPPILFETMIFGGEHNQYMDRYPTYEEALAGHQRACELAFQIP
jgi:hypothetical protein